MADSTGKSIIPEKWLNKLTDLSNWHRPLTVVGVFILLSMVGGLLATLYLLAVLAQWVMTVFMGQPNQALQEVISKVNNWVHQLMQYLNSDSEERPFPFSLLPG